jgi:hypothetical protein
VSALTTSAAGKYKNESDFDYMTVKFWVSQAPDVFLDIYYGYNSIIIGN